MYHPLATETGGVGYLECYHLSTVSSRYKLVLLKPCTKALNQSSKISLRVDHRGFLSIQCMILTNDRQVCFVEYLVRSVVTYCNPNVQIIQQWYQTVEILYTDWAKQLQLDRQPHFWVLFLLPPNSLGTKLYILNG